MRVCPPALPGECERDSLHHYGEGGVQLDMQTEPKTFAQWVRYLIVAAIAIWLVIWMLRISGINVL